MCPQATPLWETAIEPSFLLSLLYNTTFTKSTNISSYNYTAEKIDPRVTEDCLFLDVVVPQKIFDRARSYTNSTKNKSFIPKNKLAPVLVWIYGGGYVGGDKSGQDPTGLITRSQVVGEGVVYVALNYRVSDGNLIQTSFLGEREESPTQNHVLTSLLSCSSALLGGLVVNLSRRMELPTLLCTTSGSLWTGCTRTFTSSAATPLE